MPDAMLELGPLGRFVAPPSPTHRPRYFLAVFPCGRYALGRTTDGTARSCASAGAGSFAIDFLEHPALAPRDAVALVPTVELSPAEALAVALMRSPLVPPALCVAKLSERTKALHLATRYYQMLGQHDRAASLRRRLRRLHRLQDRLWGPHPSRPYPREFGVRLAPWLAPPPDPTQARPQQLADPNTSAGPTPRPAWF